MDTWLSWMRGRRVRTVPVTRDPPRSKRFPVGRDGDRTKDCLDVVVRMRPPCEWWELNENLDVSRDTREGVPVAALAVVAPCASCGDAGSTTTLAGGGTTSTSPLATLCTVDPATTRVPLVVVPWL